MCEHNEDRWHNCTLYTNYCTVHCRSIPYAVDIRTLLSMIFTCIVVDFVCEFTSCTFNLWPPLFLIGP